MNNYRTTHLEDWIYRFYRSLGIASPGEININKICKSLHIFLNYNEITSQSYVEGRFRSITLNSRLNKYEQREEFFHELCHILLHVGKQYMMPKAFLELQEAQANRFMMYAALPFYMIYEIDLTEENLIYQLSEQFQVTEKLVQKRLEQVYSRIFLYNQQKILTC